MGKGKRGRCVKKNVNNNSEPDEVVQAPHSFVIHKGLPGGHTLELTKDFRKVMEPFTASSLKERKKNTIKDFVAVAGPLHVSHLSIFSRTELGMYLKIIRLPRGPTLTFKIHNYSLTRDVISSLKRQSVVDTAFNFSPLIILNSFSGEGHQMKLMATMFQNMFPTINLTSVDLNTIKRCVLLNYNPSTKLIDFRHYTIKIVPVGVSKGVKKVVQGKVPNLARCNDISEFFTRTGTLSESEAEDDPHNHVILPQKLASRGNIESGKSAIRLSELGPRLTLQLVKIEDGLLDGEVLYHDFIHKSEGEKADIQKRREIKKKLKAKRKKIQESNVKIKEGTKQEQREKSLKIMQKLKSEAQVNGSIETSKELPTVEDDDFEYYRQEVGEEPDKDLFTAKSTGSKRKFEISYFQNKKLKLEGNKEKQTSQPFPQNKDKQKLNATNKFKSNKMIKRKGRGIDKTYSQYRDQRSIGGTKGKKNIKKQKKKS